jgi:LysM repeat protein
MTDEEDIWGDEDAGAAPAGAVGPEGFSEPDLTGDPEEALRSLERLEALAKGETPPSAPASPPPASAPGPTPSSGRGGRPRVAAAPRPVQSWARIAAPVALLVAVIVVVSLAFQSGVVGGGAAGDTPSPKPSKPATKSPKPSKSATASAKPSARPSASTSTQPAGTGQTKVYVVKAGDTLSGIAARFGISVFEIEELNADADLTTLQPGQKLTVPAP